MSAGPVKVLAFDTFGTVTDWHTGVTRVLANVFPDLDPSALARAWRRRYPPAMAEVEAGSRPWTLLDDLQRETLTDLLAREYDVVATDRQLDEAVHAWHVIPAWPDASEGLRRLKQKYTICALSNGNVALLNEMAKTSDLPWDVIGGSDLWRHYKPARETYLGLVELLQVQPHEVMMVATHATDLAAARGFGLQTAYVERPREWGPEAKAAEPSGSDVFNVRGIGELATALGC
ncbi:haloacid dehalogenase type II [Gordonia sp. HY285]|uniref:Haloacid dehalogenase type II n=1 Tax=Gordonia liuliyuniae TaxID=2911517 RepID=A0ABS9IXE0_9ACTN|nr:haloacid dehalogenase type II [Gordonia liuliyuniae]MCF8590235.1 haloacid dehalogenase type II [Gordonia liuliyuniae]MCF8611854.1 haloacid dehalogenase type II [Gordonia liuliyuniae]